MRKWLLFFLFITLKTFAMQSELDMIISQAKQEAENKKMNSVNQAQAFDPKSVFDNYTDEPTQVKYATGISDADIQQVGNSEYGTMLTDSIQERPEYVIQSTDPSLRPSVSLQSEASLMVAEETNDYKMCETNKTCPTEYEKSSDFGRSISALTSIKKAGEQISQVDPNAATLFRGEALACREKAIGYSNCCSDKGWGQNLGLAHCSSKEKKLGTARENKLAIKIGRYCSGSNPFPCLEHSQVFCVFDSKLAKIIEEQGRRGQLGIGFGSTKRPNCQGISPSQLQQIDLSRVDFQEYIDDLNKNLTPIDLKQIQSTIQSHVEQSKNTGSKM